MPPNANPPPARTTTTPHPRAARLLIGLAVCAAVTVAAYLLNALPVPPFHIVDPSQTIDGEPVIRRPLSPSIIAILLGVLIANSIPPVSLAAAGPKFIVRHLLPVAIVLTGAGLNFAVIAAIGPAMLAITVACMTIALLGTLAIGHVIGLRSSASLLLGAGTAVCGTSAIVAVAPLTDAREEDIGLSIGAVNLYGLLIMLALPFIAAALAIDATHFGVWAGTSVHAVPQAIAAGFAHSPEAGELASLVKLVRVALLAPLVIILAAILSRTHHRTPSPDGTRPGFLTLIPWFVWGFAGLTAVNTVLHLPALADTPPTNLYDIAAPWLKRAADGLLTLAMAAIGLQIHLAALIRVSGRALLAGGLATLLLAGTSYALITLIL